jgi:hypothetical protein
VSRTRSRAPATLALVVAGASACQPAPPMEQNAVTLAAGVPSDAIVVELPREARGITIVVDGDLDARFALASLEIEGAEEQLVHPATPEWLDQVVLGAGPTRQTPRRRTFTFQYPVLASQPREGTMRLRVLSDHDGVANVRAIMPIGEARTLRVALVSFTNRELLDTEPLAVQQAREILARVGIELVVDEQVFLEDVGVIEPEEPAVAPGTQLYELFEHAHALAHDALPVVFVALGDEVSGVSGGVPCPALDEHPYRAVAVDPRRDLPGVDTRHVGRVLAHELSHALGVPHPMGSSSDAFDDTDSNEPNLMNTPPSDVTADEAWERLTPQQVFAMTRSALLE